MPIEHDLNFGQVTAKDLRVEMSAPFSGALEPLQESEFFVGMYEQILV